MTRLKVGFIGCGGIARAHANRLVRFSDVELVAFSDIVVGKAEALAHKFGGRAYSDWREMLDRENLDVVFICLPPFAHRDEVMVAAEEGVHVYIEKPIALNVKLAYEMVRAIEKSGVKSQVGYQLRFAAGVERAKKLIEDGVVGDIGLVAGRYWCGFIRRDWWLDKSRSGGQVVEQATHLYDLLRWLCGNVERVYAEMDRLLYRDVPGMTIEDVSSAVLRFKCGAVGVVTATIGAAPGVQRLEWVIVGSNATLESPEPHSLKVYSLGRQPKVEEYKEAGRDPMTLAERDLIEAVINDKPTRTPIIEGAKTLELTLAVVKAAELGKPQLLGR